MSTNDAVKISTQGKVGSVVVSKVEYRPLRIILKPFHLHSYLSVYPCLTAILRCYNAYACIASPSRQLSFPQIYVNTLRVCLRTMLNDVP